MADTTAHLVDRVLPEVPVRQWVLALPYPLRDRYAWNARLPSEVLLAMLAAASMPAEAAKRRSGWMRTPRRTTVEGAGSQVVSRTLSRNSAAMIQDRATSDARRPRSAAVTPDPRTPTVAVAEVRRRRSG